MLRHYNRADNEEGKHARFVLLKWGAAVLRPYWDRAH
jgi:hypothetical protein